MAVILTASWVSFVMGTLNEMSTNNDYLKKAQESVENRLYEQAIEYYKESLKHDLSEETYVMIQQTYGLLYGEEHTAFFRKCYITDMAEAASRFPGNELFWQKQVELYMEEGNKSRAFEVLKAAMRAEVESEKLNAEYKELAYSVRTDYRSYGAFKTALNGYITVFDGSGWLVMDNEGELLTGQYPFIGLINDNGQGIYTNSIDTRLLDSNQVTRARFDIEVEDAGCYDAAEDLVPVKQNGTWRYMNTKGEFLPGSFDVAGSFYKGQAVACSNDEWMLLDSVGNQKKLNGIQDVKLDLHGFYIQNGIIIAKENGKYGFYDSEFNRIGSFHADDMDLYLSDKGIAFKQNGKWGFADAEGNILVQPAYTDAKSFSNGYAAVCNEEGLWGFLNSRYELVIDHAYVDAHYFTKAETCMVSNSEGMVQMLEFVFD